MTTTHDTFNQPVNPLAESIADQLQCYLATTVGNCVLIPRLPGGSVAEVAEIVGIDEELIGEHPEYPGRCWLIECPE